MGPAFRLPWRIFRTSKRGHTEAECEDAWAFNPRAGRFAIADGASESSYSGLWAKLLAETFVAANRPWGGFDWLDGPRLLWSAEVDGQQLEWYGEMKREQGAYSTLLGLGLQQPTGDHAGRWQALAVGDSCLIRVRNGDRAFPLTKAVDFNNQPQLLGSRPGPSPELAIARGTSEPGDRLLLMTDALAHWFLLDCEKKGRPWMDVERLLTERQAEGAFAVWVDKLRDRGELRNDDVTLLVVGPMPNPKTVSKE
jgi:serine/threonine protein phosphatase PrpC